MSETSMKERVLAVIVDERNTYDYAADAAIAIVVEEAARVANEWRMSVGDGTFTAAEVEEMANTMGPNIAAEILRLKEDKP
jgi:hypothetical protein